jgi:hypothetical protein
MPATRYHTVTATDEDVVAALSLPTTAGRVYVFQNRSDVATILLEERATGATRAGVGLELLPGERYEYRPDATTPVFAWCSGTGRQATLVVQERP